jgi:hypothetical protein
MAGEKWGIAWGCLPNATRQPLWDGCIVRSTWHDALLAICGVVSVSGDPCMILNISIRLERDKQMLSE